MLSISRAILRLGLVLLVIGALLGGWGVYLNTACDSGYRLIITELEENETAHSTAEQVAYSNLTATEQQVFQDTLTTGETPRYQNDTLLEGLSGKVVTYRGEQYETHLFVFDCFHGGESVMIGGIIALFGGVMVVAASGWRLLR